MGKKLQLFVLSFDNPSSVYFPGQTLTGFIDVQLNGTMSMRGIQLRILGKAYVHWSEGSGDSSRDYSAQEIYINVTVPIVGSLDSSSRMELAAGSYRYPFTMNLPANLPSSYEGGKAVTAWVRYTAEAIIDRPWKRNKVNQQPFTVVSLVDLNKFPADVQQPIQTDTEGKVSCCCWKCGNVNASLRINRSCFVPGETINIDADIVNNSTEEIKSRKLKLTQIDVYRACGGHKTLRNERAIIERREPLPRGATDVWSGVSLIIPPLPPTQLGGGCGIIDVSYVLSLRIAARCSKVKVKTNILIGTIPLTQQPPPYQFGVICSQPAGPTYPRPLSYQQCPDGPMSITEANDTSRVQGNQSWAPKYPYYAPSAPELPDDKGSYNNPAASITLDT